MKQSYTNALFYNLIDKLDYMPFRGQDGNVVMGERFRILQKYTPGGYYIVEIADGDALSAYDIKQQMDAARSRLMEIRDDGSIYYYFKIFLFTESPEYFKVQEIFSGQLEETFFKRFLSCFTVDLANEQVRRHFNIPAGTDGLEGLLHDLFFMDVDRFDKLRNMEDLLEKKQEEQRIVYKVNRPVITYALIAVNVAVWAALHLFALYYGEAFGDLLIFFGAKENVLIMLGQYWRFITPLFLHANLAHIFFNSYSLYAVGTYVEKLYGRPKFLLIYFIAGFTGSIASFIFSINPGVGASGAIFGLLGAMLHFGVESPKAFKRYFGYNVIAVTVINIVLGFSTPGIDNFAHIGGLIGGFLAAGIVRVKSEKAKKRERIGIAVITVLLIAVGLYWGFHSQQNLSLLREFNRKYF